ncbi:MAG: hypothetical protein ACTSXZ_04085 [Alphaproteobacteria bacterium]
MRAPSKGKPGIYLLTFGFVVAGLGVWLTAGGLHPAQTLGEDILLAMADPNDMDSPCAEAPFESISEVKSVKFPADFPDTGSLSMLLRENFLIAEVFRLRFTRWIPPTGPPFAALIA